MQHKRSQGEYIGGAAPYGYALADEAWHSSHRSEQAIITEARTLRTAGISLRAVAEQLDGKALRARNGAPVRSVAGRADDRGMTDDDRAG